MSTLAPEVAATLIHDYDAIAAVIRLYLDGVARGDLGKLREAFHKDARIFGQELGQRYDVPIEELVKEAVRAPLDSDGRFRGRLTSVTVAGDAAVATVAEDGCWCSVSYVDFMSLVRINGSWKIVNKTFTHTGGIPPSP